MKALRSILVPVDFTPCSRAALQEALRLAAATGAKVSAFHVIDTLIVTELEEATSTHHSRVNESVREGARGAWEAFARTIDGAANLPFEVVIEERTRAIVDAAKRAGADLLVLGAFGTRRANVGVGTVATTAVRHAPCDVLLVRDTHAGPFHDVIACVDFSPTSGRAVEYARVLAERDGARVHALHLFEPPWRRLHYRAPTFGTDPAFQKQYRDRLRGMVQEFCAARTQGAAKLELHHELFEWHGHRSGIVAYAEMLGADLLVLGTRGRTSVRDLVLGSTAERVLAEATCSILAVRPPA